MLRASGERELAEISSPSYRVSIILTDSMTYSHKVFNLSGNTQPISTNKVSNESK